MLNYIKDSLRTTLSQENTNHIIRIRHNGPRIGAINIEPYTDKYLEKFEHCDPLHVSKAAKKVKKLESENVHTNIFSRNNIIPFQNNYPCYAYLHTYSLLLLKFLEKYHFSSHKNQMVDSGTMLNIKWMVICAF